MSLSLNRITSSILTSLLVLTSSSGLAAQSIERITINGNRNATQSPVATTANVNTLNPDDSDSTPTNLARLLHSVPGISFVGQGGLFQTVGLRGMSRWRVPTFIGDIPLYTERRAGTTASFIPPQFLESVNVIKGPSSTYYGSGALGGLVQLNPKHAHNVAASLTLTDAKYDQQTLEAGNEQWSVALSRQHAGNSEDVQGNTLYDHFDQQSALIDHHWAFDNGLESDTFYLYSNGDDIGKSSKDYPNKKIVSYPDEQHHLLQWRLTRPHDWSLSLFAHDQSLETETIRPAKRVNTVSNESLDLGGHWVKEWQGGDFNGRWGADYIARRGVKASEFERSLKNDSTSQQQNIDASQDEYALFADASTQLDSWQLVAGMRAARYQQSGEGAEDHSDTAVTGFIGAVYTRGEQQEWKINLGNAYRFPSLTEHYYSGSTGRGTIVANSDLVPEKSTTAELTLTDVYGDFAWQLAAYYSRVSDYIERVSIAEETLSYRNVDSGSIKGLEYRIDWRPSEQFTLGSTGQWIDAVSDEGDRLADAGRNELGVNMEYRWSDFSFSTGYRYLAPVKEPASGELTRDAANLVEAAMRYQITPNLSAKVWSENLTNESYFYSSDELATLARGRQFGITLSYQFQ
ncbi:TonB-dependent siderophore receptor [Shewanella loihica]|uniref:TonB-dependent receptor n=1 Tax=Shewanella loihica (strain ATCC BAA-1088 / PV-4) TaxID=323850 RepID=A3QI09_SHELP|nr:TonB-dependent receptor [Shewanella loihica]ABO25107.1 TonB-dependent receptor [Shewanella loihica PV-4]